MNKQKRNPWIIIVPVVMVIAAVVIALAFALTRSSNDSNNNTNSNTATVTPTTTSSSTPTPSDTVTPTTTPSQTDATVTPTITPTSTITTTPVVSNNFTIYFSKNPDSFTDSSVTVAATRTPTATLTAIGDKVLYVVNSILAGPNSTEKSTGLFTPFSLSGTSTCTGGYSYQYQFTGKQVEIQFCKDINETQGPAGSGTAGSGLKAEQRVLNVLTSSLKQITGVDTVFY